MRGSTRTISSRQRRRHWIPPGGLVAGQLAHGLSWLLLLVLATRKPFALGLPAVGWLHLVALGWLTMTALAVLVHAIPSFTDAVWKWERLARGALVLYGAGVVALVVAFWTQSAAALPFAASLVVLGLLCYLVPAGRTLTAAFAHARQEAAIARALAVTLASLLVTAVLGVGLAWALAGRGSSSLLSYGPPVHASFGLIGWLTVLVMGVSTRTVRPITGVRSRYPWAHIAAGSLEIGGLALAVAGWTFRESVIQWIGAIAVLAGALVYVGDLTDILRRATVAHRPPQAFLGAAAVWLVVGLSFGLVSAVEGAQLGAATIYVLLVGWIGQMVNAHIHHIGIRLVATVVRGDDDETPPDELLASPLSWTSFGLFQAAVAAGAAALIFGTPGVLELAAFAGLFGWIVLIANVVHAARRAAFA